MAGSGKTAVREGASESDDLRAVTRLVDGLRRRQWQISGAESCTAGLAAALIASVPGASDVFPGSFVSYQERMKMRWLGVSEELLAQHGAVSEACARAMAEGARKAAETEIAFAVTGFAGPGGGTEKEPVGTVFLAVSIQGHCLCRRCFFHGSRQEIRDQAVRSVLAFCLSALDETDAANEAGNRDDNLDRK